MTAQNFSHLKKGDIYSLRSRHLRFGVWDGKDGFVGIRNKFGRRFLDTELHWDTGPPHGTANPIVKVGRWEGELSHESKELMEYLEKFDGLLNEAL